MTLGRLAFPTSPQNLPVFLPPNSHRNDRPLPRHKLPCLPFEVDIALERIENRKRIVLRHFFHPPGALENLAARSHVASLMVAEYSCTDLLEGFCGFGAERRRAVRSADRGDCVFQCARQSTEGADRHSLYDVDVTMADAASREDYRSRLERAKTLEQLGLKLSDKLEVAPLRRQPARPRPRSGAMVLGAWR